MNLTSVDTICSGNCILFLGAGFSTIAINIGGKKVLSAWDLQTYLLSSCGIINSNDYDLESAAEEFIDKFGEEEISKLIYNNFTVKETSPIQEDIVCQPWKRIYTSNYDDIVEKSCAKFQKKITIKEITDKVEPPFHEITQLIHIYGNVTRSSVSEFKTKLLLTESQRDNSPFLNSPWFRRFSDDVMSCDSIIFCGFALRDLDIRRLLGLLPPEAHSKTHFIDWSGAPKSTQNRMARFGNVHLIGIDGFASHLQKKRSGPPLHTSISRPPTVKEYIFEQQTSAKIANNDIESLLASGDLNTLKLSSLDMLGIAGSYTFKRQEVKYTRVLQSVGKDKPVLVHSEIGNGKSVFLAQLAYKLNSSGYATFYMNREPDNVGDIVSFFQNTHGKTAVFFDDLMKFNKIISSLVALGRSDLLIVASVRTTLLETARSVIENRLGNRGWFEVELNISSEEQIRYILQYLDENGLLGEYAEFNKKERTRFLTDTCRGQVRDILLALFETGSLQQKVQAILERVADLNPSEREIILLSALMTNAGLKSFDQLYEIAQVTGYNGSYEDLKQSLAQREITGLLRLESGSLSFRSPALAEFMLKRVCTLTDILSVAKKSLFRLSAMYNDDQEADAVSRSLLKFSLYGRLAKRKSDEAVLDDFYTECRTLSIAQRDPLFLIQRSISTMHFENFPMANQYVATAYARAKSKPNFDTYQIDTHFAKLMLTETLKHGLSDNLNRETKSQELLETVLSRSTDDLYHPLSVMRLYHDIVLKWTHSMLEEQKNNLKLLIDRAINKMNQASKFQSHKQINIDAIRRKLKDAKRD